jgi:hypothetical protein
MSPLVAPLVFAEGEAVSTSVVVSQFVEMAGLYAPPMAPGTTTIRFEATINIGPEGESEFGPVTRVDKDALYEVKVSDEHLTYNLFDSPVRGPYRFRVRALDKRGDEVPQSAIELIPYFRIAIL